MDEQNLQNEQNLVEEPVVEETAVEQTVQDTNNYQDYTAEYQANPITDPAPAKENNTLAVVSLVLGIIAIVSGCCGSGFMFGIGGIICAVLANKQKKTGMATGGLITSIIGIVLSIIATVIIAIFYVAAYSMSY